MPEVVEGAQLEPTELEQKGGSVPLTKYVGVKEMLKKREETLATTQSTLEQTKAQAAKWETELKSLGEQLEAAKKSAVDPEKVKALESERDTAKKELAQMKKEGMLKEHGVNPKDVEGMSDEQIQAFIKGKGQAVKPDLGHGGSATQAGSGFDKMRAGFDALHPKDK